MRKIPVTMATQHPDNAKKPYWNSRAFISTSAEIKESFLCFNDLSIDEYNWDWEGKFVDEAVVDRLLHEHHDYFQNHILGEDKFLTFRIPNPRVEKQFRLARAFMVIVTSSQLAQSLGYRACPIFETILPLTETAEEILELQKAYRDLVSIEHRLLAMENSLQHIEIIPLFEQVGTIIKSEKILRSYISHHVKLFGYKPTYLRPYCARSDPALNSGLVPTIIALKIALSLYLDLEKDSGVRLYPMLGTGGLPFRGAVTPVNIESVLEEYGGVATLILQSAFRYDYKKSDVKKAITLIHEKLPLRKAHYFSQKQRALLKKTIPFFETPYRKTVEKIASYINRISLSVAKRRERMLHVGLFGYSRGIGKVTLPRAIPFTASLYSLGVPPELIGTGRGLSWVEKYADMALLKKAYPTLLENIVFAGSFLNRENLLKLSKRNNAWAQIQTDVKLIEKILGTELGPKTHDHKEHYNLATTLYTRLKEDKEVSQLITLGGLIRKSLG